MKYPKRSIPSLWDVKVNPPLATDSQPPRQGSILLLPLVAHKVVFCSSEVEAYPGKNLTSEEGVLISPGWVSAPAIEDDDTEGLQELVLDCGKDIGTVLLNQRVIYAALNFLLLPPPPTQS
jgi:hypothetical protein